MTRMPKNINSLIVLDFETGGLDCRKHAVTQIAAIAIKGDTFEKIDLLSAYIKPYGEFEYQAEALKYTGVTMENLYSGVSVEEAVAEFIDLLFKADLYPRNKGAKPILVAHNSAFDKGFLLQLFNYCGKLKELEKLTYGSTDYYGNYQPEFLDTIHLAKIMWGNDEDMPNFKLGTCIEKAGLDLSDAHTALNDTVALKDMVVRLAENLRSGTGETTELAVGSKFRNHFQF
jgi:DNA polymerase III epsilon subunit-like protein